MDYTKEALAEYIACYKSPAYFIQTYLGNFRNITEPLVSENCLLVKDHSGNDHLNILAYIVWCLTFQYERTIGIISKDTKHSKITRRELLDLYENVPEFFRQPIRTNTSSALKLANGMKILFGPNLTHVRGHGISMFYGDDYANWPGLQQQIGIFGYFHVWAAIRTKVILSDRITTGFEQLWNTSSIFGKIG